MLKPTTMYSFKCDPDGDQYTGSEIVTSVCKYGTFLGKFGLDDFFESDDDSEYSFYKDLYDRKSI